MKKKRRGDDRGHTVALLRSRPAASDHERCRIVVHVLRTVRAGIRHPRSSLFFFQAEDGIRDRCVTGVQTCALPIFATQRMPFPHISDSEPSELNILMATSA